jgi:hypothetical protein
VRLHVSEVASLLGCRVRRSKDSSSLPMNRRFNGMKEEATLGGIFDFNARDYSYSLNACKNTMLFAISCAVSEFSSKRV